ncbi:MAG: hypothetical protein M5U01_00255 [Ardenticatenaceae bacterium]|nr:hypothetical protein [Ardenticatenaceae bacterium]
MIDISTYITERTRNFTGRTWVFEAIDDWLSTPGGPRFFLLTGEPGSGKTAIAARLTQFSLGTVPPLDGLARLRADCLSAVHFCSARDRRWINPHVFAECLALQLAARHPAFASALAGKSGDRQLHIEIIQHVGQVSGGQVTGVVIKKLDVSAVPPDDAFVHVVREPLEALFGEYPDQQVVILVDALDEALLYSQGVGILSLLAQANRLPRGVRFILTSRRDDRIENAFLDADTLFLSAGEFDRRNAEDVRRYIEARLSHDETLAAGVAGWPRERVHEFVAELTAKAEGNFQYVTFLLDAMVSGQRPPDELRGLPPGLDGLYYESLDRVVTIGGREWSTAYGPILGVLSVAQASLTLDQARAFTAQPEEAAWQHLGDLRQFIEDVEPAADEPVEEYRYRLYHQSVVDFLRRQFLTVKNKRLRNRYYLPAETWHRRIADSYWESYHDDWLRCDAYGLNNLAAHLFESGDAGRLPALISREWMEARYKGSNYTYTGFLADLDLAWMAAVAQRHVDLRTLARLKVARQVVNEQVRAYTSKDLETLVWLGRVDEALAHARLIQDSLNPEKPFDFLLAIYNTLKEMDRPDTALLDEMWEVACSIQNDEARAEALRELGAILAQAGDGRARAVLEEALAAARLIQWSPTRAEALCRLGMVVAQSDRRQASAVLDEAVVAARAAIHEHPDRTQALPKLFAEAGRYEEAQEIARAIQDDHWRDEGLIEVATALARGSRYTEARQIVDTLASPRQSRGLRTLAAALTSAGQLDEAREALDALAPFDSDVLAPFKRADLAAALARAGRYDEAEQYARANLLTVWEQAPALSELAVALAQAGKARAGPIFEEALAAARAIDDDSGRARILGNLATDLAKTQPEWARAAREAARAAARAIGDTESRATALSDLAAALIPAGDEQGNAILGEALTAARALRPGSDLIKALRHLTRTLLRADRYGDALVVAQAIQDNRGRAWTLQEVAAALARRGDPRAGAVFDEAVATRTAAPGSESALVYPLRELGAALGQLGRYDAARQVIGDIPNERWRVDEFIRLAATLSQAGDSRADAAFAEAMAAVRTMENESWREEAARDLVTALVQTGRYNQAAELIATVQMEAKPWVAALCTLAKALSRAGDSRAGGVFEEAEAVARSIEWEGSRVDALIVLAKSLSAAGDSRADAIFEEAEEIARALSSDRWRDLALRDLATALAQASRYRQAWEVAWEIKTLSPWAEALFDLTAALAKAGRYDEAEKVAHTIEADRQRNEALVELAKALFQAGRYEDAEKRAYAIQDEYWRRSALREIAVAFAEAGRDRDAIATARAIPLDSGGAWALLSVAEVLGPAHAGRLRTVLAEAVEAARTLRDDSDRISTLRNLAIALARIGDARADALLDGIRAVGVAIEHVGWWMDAQIDLAEAFARAGLLREALIRVETSDLDKLLAILAEWAPQFEELEAGLSLAVLHEASGVAGWVRPDWRKIHELLAAVANEEE